MRSFSVVVPPIKCQGIKTKLIPSIKAIAPSNIHGRWIEPFMGSGVVAFNMAPRKALLADTNPHIINFYRNVAAGNITVHSARKYIEKEGALLFRTEGEHYYAVRERFNKTAEPLDFLFLNRAGFNGMIRFNRHGGLNVPFCRKPNRYAKAYVTKICNQIRMISELCGSGCYEFKCQNYLETISDANRSDVLYCDPPYIDRHADYYNGWDESCEYDLANALNKSPSCFILSAWHSNAYRSNRFIDSIWVDYNVYLHNHFYHIGAREENRKAMLEALITNYESKKYLAYSAKINDSPVVRLNRV